MTAQSKPATTDVLLDLHRRMVRIRSFEESLGRLFEAGEVPGHVSLCIGQEAVATGVCAALDDHDQVASTHRGHGHLIARGGRLDLMMAEIMGKSSGYGKGKAGSMHVSAPELGMLGANGIVGAGAPLAVGAAFASRYQGSDGVAVVFFGDGAANTGAVHEAANMAAALELGVLFVCENNGYGVSTSQDAAMAIGDVVDRAAGYGMAGVTVDGMDVVAVFEAASAAVDRARRHRQPTLIEAKTYRFQSHRDTQASGHDSRDEQEVQRWQARDPVFTFEARLQDAAVVSQIEIDDVWAQVRDEVDAAVQFARTSELPSPADLGLDVYAPAGGESS